MLDSLEITHALNLAVQRNDLQAFAHEVKFCAVYTYVLYQLIYWSCADVSWHPLPHEKLNIYDGDICRLDLRRIACQAAENGRTGILRLMSQLGVKLKTITDPELGSNLVYAAATNKQTNTISWLSQCGGVDVNGVDLMGRSALHIAAENNDLAVRAYNSSPSILQSDAFPSVMRCYLKFYNYSPNFKDGQTLNKRSWRQHFLKGLSRNHSNFACDWERMLWHSGMVKVVAFVNMRRFMSLRSIWQ